MPRLLFATGQNSPTQHPSHFGVVTAGSTIKAWHAEQGSIHINQSRFSLSRPTAIAITSTHKPETSNAPNQPIMAVGTDYGLIHLINLNNGELIQTLRQLEDPKIQTQSRPLSVRDLFWSKDGKVLYSLATKYVFVWRVGNKVAQHQRLNIFGPLLEAAANQAGMSENTKRLVDTSFENLSRIALNHNEDKLILGANGSVYVYDLLTQTILAKYIGFLGKVSALSVDSAPRNYTSQYHHDVVQTQFKNGSRDLSGTTEFFIIVSSLDDNNATIYQYPPVATKAQLMLAKEAKGRTSSTEFIVSETATATCTLPATAINLELCVIYDNLGLVTPQNIVRMTEAEKEMYAPLKASQRPNFLLAAATTNGSVSVFSIPGGPAGTITGSKPTMVDAIPTKKGKKGAVATESKNEPIFTLQTYHHAHAQSTIHDPAISNQHKALGKEASSTVNLNSVKAVKKGAVGNHANHNFQVKIFQEGSINNAFILSLGQLCVVRNSTLRPKAETIHLVPTAAQPQWVSQLHPDAPKPPSAFKDKNLPTVVDMASKIQQIVATWKAMTAVEKFRITTNTDLQLSLAQDKLLFDAVKATSKRGIDQNILLGGTQQGSLTKMSVRAHGEETVETAITQQQKRQRLLSHTAKINASLRNILEDNQDKIGLLSLAPAFQQNQSFSEMNPYDAFPALQGTLCGVLVQGLKSGDDTSIEYCIKQGVQGLNSQYGWGTLTRLLNNPDSLRYLQTASAKTDSRDNKADDYDSEEGKKRQFNDLGIAIVGSQWTQVSHKNVAIGKTIIQTVLLLPSAFIIPFVTVLTDKLAAAPLRSFELLPWIHVLLRLHSAYLLSTPAVNEKLSQISLLLRQRTTTMDAAVQLKGRLEVILTQFNTSASALSSSSKASARKTDNGFVPLNVYSEGDQLSDFHSLEDVADSFDLRPNYGKRKTPPQDNFAESGLSLDDLGDLDYDEEEDGDFDGEGDDWMGVGEDGFGDLIGEGEDGFPGDFADDEDFVDSDAGDVDDEMFDSEADDDFDLSDDEL